MGRSVVLLEDPSATKFRGTKVPNDRKDLEAVFVLVNASIALLPEVPGTSFTAYKAAPKHPALGFVAEKRKVIRILHIINSNPLLPH